MYCSKKFHENEWKRSFKIMKSTEFNQWNFRKLGTSIPGLTMPLRNSILTLCSASTPGQAQKDICRDKDAVVENQQQRRQTLHLTRSASETAECSWFWCEFRINICLKWNVETLTRTFDKSCLDALKSWWVCPYQALFEQNPYTSNTAKRAPRITKWWLEFQPLSWYVFEGGQRQASWASSPTCVLAKCRKNHLQAKQMQEFSTCSVSQGTIVYTNVVLFGQENIMLYTILYYYTPI